MLGIRIRLGLSVRLMLRLGTEFGGKIIYSSVFPFKVVELNICWGILFDYLGNIHRVSRRVHTSYAQHRLFSTWCPGQIRGFSYEKTKKGWVFKTIKLIKLVIWWYFWSLTTFPALFLTSEPLHGAVLRFKFLLHAELMQRSWGKSSVAFAISLGQIFLFFFCEFNFLKDRPFYLQTKARWLCTPANRSCAADWSKEYNFRNAVACRWVERICFAISYLLPPWMRP